MMTTSQIALKEQINELNAKIRYLGLQEEKKALEIQDLIRKQAFLYDTVTALEILLDKERNP